MSKILFGRMKNKTRKDSKGRNHCKCTAVYSMKLTQRLGFVHKYLFGRMNNETSKDPKRAVFVNSREVAPASATENMFQGSNAPSSTRGQCLLLVLKRAVVQW